MKMILPSLMGHDPLAVMEPLPWDDGAEVSLRRRSRRDFAWLGMAQTSPTVFPVQMVAGKDCYAYINTGNEASPTWVSADNIKDVDLGIDPGAWDAGTRFYRPFEVSMPTQIKLNPKFKVAWIGTNSGSLETLLNALLNAYENGTALDIMFLDGPNPPTINTNYSQGPRANWMVSKFDRNEHLAEGVEADVELKPAPTGNVPTWYVSAA